MNVIKIKNLNTKILGQKIIYFKEIDSTQKEVFRRIRNNDITNGTIIWSDKQTQGVGTHGRKWFTQENNIAFSFVLFPKSCNIKEFKNFTIDIAQIIKEILEDLYGIHVKIKHPNDLIIEGKKVGGILSEAKILGENVKQLVIGVGINTNQKIFDKEIKDIATSIKNEFDIEIDNKKIIKEFCIKFEKNFLDIIDNNSNKED